MQEGHSVLLLSFYRHPPSNLPDGQVVPCQKYIGSLVLGCTSKIYSLPLNVTGSQKVLNFALIFLHKPQSCQMGCSPGHSQPYQVSSKSVQEFWLPEGSKSAIFLCLVALWLIGPYNRLGLPPNV